MCYLKASFKQEYQKFIILIMIIILILFYFVVFDKHGVYKCMAVLYPEVQIA